MLPWLLVNECSIACIPFHLLPPPEGCVYASLEVLNALVLKQEVEALDPLLFA